MPSLVAKRGSLRTSRGTSLASVSWLDLLKVPLPVPPMIEEEAFGYRRHERYVSLSFGTRGGVMKDAVEEGAPLETKDLYRSYLIHHAVKPYVDAFDIESDPPEFCKFAAIRSDTDIERFETWSETSRCLLLDRKDEAVFGRHSRRHRDLVDLPADSVPGIEDSCAVPETLLVIRRGNICALVLVEASATNPANKGFRRQLEPRV